jgi:hypothetical protein
MSKAGTSLKQRVDDADNPFDVILIESGLDIEYRNRAVEGRPGLKG